MPPRRTANPRQVKAELVRSVAQVNKSLAASRESIAADREAREDVSIRIRRMERILD